MLKMNDDSICQDGTERLDDASSTHVEVGSTATRTDLSVDKDPPEHSTDTAPLTNSLQRSCLEEMLAHAGAWLIEYDKTLESGAETEEVD